jgi:hypothetical protein
LYISEPHWRQDEWICLEDPATTSKASGNDVGDVHENKEKQEHYPGNVKHREQPFSGRHGDIAEKTLFRPLYICACHLSLIDPHLDLKNIAVIEASISPESIALRLGDQGRTSFGVYALLQQRLRVVAYRLIHLLFQ